MARDARTWVLLTPEEKERLRAAAKARSFSMSSLIRKIILGWLYNGGPDEDLHETPEA